MVIKLLAGPPQPGTEGVGPNIAGIESFELKHIERLHLDLGEAKSRTGGRAERAHRRGRGFTGQQRAGGDQL